MVIEYPRHFIMFIFLLRNPGSVEPTPWCFVDSSHERIIEPCDIPKCADKIWIAIVGTGAATVLIFIIIFAIIVFRRRRIMHYGMRNIHNVSISLPQVIGFNSDYKICVIDQYTERR